MLLYNVRERELWYSGKLKFLLGANFRDFHEQTCFCENKNVKISSEESGHISAKFCISEKFLLYFV